MYDLINQKWISPYDFGFLYGFSLFETFFVREDGTVFLLKYHIDRLFKSLNFFDIVIDMNQEKLLDYIRQYIAENNIKGKVIRLTVSSGNKAHAIKPVIVLTARDFTGGNHSCYKLMISSVKKDPHSMILRHKTSNYLENLLEGRSANKKDCDDALFLNIHNNLAETTKCNIFFVQNNIVRTPDLDCGILPGITRQWAIEQVSKLGLQFVEGSFTLEELMKADEVFVTNSVIGIKGVNIIDGHSISGDGCRGVTKQLISQYDTMKI